MAMERGFQRRAGLRWLQAEVAVVGVGCDRLSCCGWLSWLRYGSRTVVRTEYWVVEGRSV